MDAIVARLNDMERDVEIRDRRNSARFDKLEEGHDKIWNALSPWLGDGPVKLLVEIREHVTNFGPRITAVETVLDTNKKAAEARDKVSGERVRMGLTLLGVVLTIVTCLISLFAPYIRNAVAEDIRHFFAGNPVTWIDPPPGDAGVRRN